MTTPSTIYLATRSRRSDDDITTYLAEQFATYEADMYRRDIATLGLAATALAEWENVWLPDAYLTRDAATAALEDGERVVEITLAEVERGLRDAFAAPDPKYPTPTAMLDRTIARDSGAHFARIIGSTGHAEARLTLAELETAYHVIITNAAPIGEDDDGFDATLAGMLREQPELRAGITDPTLAARLEQAASEGGAQ